MSLSKPPKTTRELSSANCFRYTTSVKQRAPWSTTSPRAPSCACSSIVGSRRPPLTSVGRSPTTPSFAIAPVPSRTCCRLVQTRKLSWRRSRATGRGYSPSHAPRLVRDPADTGWQVWRWGAKTVGERRGKKGMQNPQMMINHNRCQTFKKVSIIMPVCQLCSWRWHFFEGRRSQCQYYKNLYRRRWGRAWISD